LWKHPIHRGGAIPHSPGPMGNLFRIVNLDFRELMFYDVR
jgi:hypothetical protein